MGRGGGEGEGGSGGVNKTNINSLVTREMRE